MFLNLIYFLKALFVLLALCFASKSYSNDIEFIVVDEVNSVDANSLGKEPFSYPWEHQLTDEEKKAGIFFVYNSCGLASYVFRGTNLSEYKKINKPIRKLYEITVNLGEFCDIRNFIPAPNVPRLFVTKIWQGKRYFIDFFEVRVDIEGRHFLSSRDWVLNTNTKNYVNDMVYNSEENVPCIDRSMKSDEWVDIEATHEYAIPYKGQQVCYNRGIYLYKLAELLNSGKLYYRSM